MMKMKKMMRLAVASGLLAAVLLALAGCTEPPSTFACITADPTIGYAPLTVTLDASCSYIPPERYGVYYVTWRFDDGTAGDVGQVVEHTFVEPGTYEVAATIFKSGEGIPLDGATRTVTVLPVP
jgi:PKD repeat protein